MKGRFGEWVRGGKSLLKKRYRHLIRRRQSIEDSQRREDLKKRERYRHRPLFSLDSYDY